MQSGNGDPVKVNRRDSSDSGEGTPISANRPVEDFTESDAERLQFLVGKGNWNAFDLPLELVFEAVSHWEMKLKGVDKPWLCWNVDPDWCLLQQKMVEAVGWTPVIGSDPRAAKPTLSTNAIMIDFNAEFNLPTMYPHFPIEFVFRYVDRLAFWHSDLLLRLPKMQKLAEMFESIPDSEMAAVPDCGGLRNIFNRRSHRYWELIGCTTRGASASQFEKGCGWWMEFEHHPNFKSQSKKSSKRFYWDYGTGIMNWVRRYGGVVHPIKESYVSEGHFTRINNPQYELLSPTMRRNLSQDLTHNFSLSECARSLDLEEYLVESSNG